MKSLIILIIFFGIVRESAAQLSDTISFTDMKDDISWFIKVTRPRTPNEGRSNVYLVKFTCEEKQYCYTIGFICEAWAYERKKEDYMHYMKINNELVLIQFSEEFKKKYSLHNAEILKLESNDPVLKKLLTSVSVGFASVYDCCYLQNTIFKHFTFNSGDLPEKRRP